MELVHMKLVHGRCGGLCASVVSGSVGELGGPSQGAAQAAAWSGYKAKPNGVCLWCVGRWKGGPPVRVWVEHTWVRPSFCAVACAARQVLVLPTGCTSCP
jgi:hypothetical protein